jgi:hypothetical protein
MRLKGRRKRDNVDGMENEEMLRKLEESAESHMKQAI